MRLGAKEARVLGVLLEKQLSTPQWYPLTLAALVTGCNQSTNRDPVVAYDDGIVNAAIHDLKQQRLARSILPSHGRGVVRFRHVADETLGLDARQCALLAVLLLRGPQTPGELRTRTDRMVQFDGLEDIEGELRFLATREEALALALSRQPGQKEERWVCPLVEGSGSRAHDGPAAHDSDAPEPEYESEAAFGSESEFDSDTAPERPSRPVVEDGSPQDALQSLDDIRAALAQLQAEVSDLSRDLYDLRDRLGD